MRTGARFYNRLSWRADRATLSTPRRSRLVVAGATAGARPAAALVLLARDRGGPRIAFQLLVSAMLDDRMATPSSKMRDALI